MAWQLASLASLVASGAVAVRFGRLLAPCFGAQEPWNLFLAMLVLFVATSPAVWLLFRLVSGILDRVKLKQFDLQLGAVLGAAKGVLWCLVITFFAVTLSESTRRAVLPSRSGYYIARLIHRGGPVLPEEIRAVLGKYLDELDRQFDPRGKPQPAGGALGTRSGEIQFRRSGCA